MIRILAYAAVIGALFLALGVVALGSLARYLDRRENP